MPVLQNIRREIFAQEVVKGGHFIDAYEKAGFKRNGANATTLRKVPEVAARIDELLAQKQAIHLDAMKVAIVETGISIGRVLLEIATLGFANMDDFVDRTGDQVVIALKSVTRTQMAAVQEIATETFVERDANGEPREVTRVKLKLYDKGRSLVDMGKHLGMFPSKVEVTGKDGGPIEHEVNGAALLDEISRRLDGIAERNGAPTIIEGVQPLRIEQS